MSKSLGDVMVDRVEAHSTEREKMLEASVSCLQKENQDLKKRLENTKYEQDSHLEDEVEDLKKQISTLDAALNARKEHYTPGDICYVESQDVMNGLNPQQLAKIAQNLGIVFLCAKGVDQLRKLNNVELEKMNLKKLDPRERTTAIQKLDSIFLDINKTIAQHQWEPEEAKTLFWMRDKIADAVGAFKGFEEIIQRKVDNAKREPKPEMVGGAV